MKKVLVFFFCYYIAGMGSYCFIAHRPFFDVGRWIFATLVALAAFLLRSQFDLCTDCGHRRFDHWGGGGYSFCVECAVKWRHGITGCRHGRY